MNPNILAQVWHVLWFELLSAFLRPTWFVPPLPLVDGRPLVGSNAGSVEGNHRSKHTVPPILSTLFDQHTVKAVNIHEQRDWQTSLSVTLRHSGMHR
jgi:hypothetical protein